jgi:putative membrane protein
MKKNLNVIITIAAAIFMISCGGDTYNVNVTRNSLPGANTATNSSSANNAPINANLANANMPGTENAGRNQNDFWTKAAQGGIAEVELSRVADGKAQNAEVKDFARMMITDHTKANEELKSLAAKKNVMLPTEMDGEHQAIMANLKNLSGAEFDRSYVETMVNDHEKTVALFEKQANENNADAELKAFAAKTLPTLRTHLEMIKNIQNDMK